MPAVLHPEDVPDWPLPVGLGWQWSRHSRSIHVVHGAMTTWKSVAEIDTTVHGSYRVTTGRHRRVEMRRCFRQLAAALRFTHRWACLRGADVVAELEGRAADPTLGLDAREHDWREVRAARAGLALLNARGREPAKGVCRIERPSKGGMGR